MRTCAAALLLVGFIQAAQVTDGENPFKRTKIGDWVEYQMTGPNMEGKTKMTVTAKDDKQVSYDITSKMSFMGKEMVGPVQKQTIDLTQSYDAISAANLKAKNAKIENEGEGKEKLKVGDKEFDTKWKKLKATTTFNNVTVVTSFKMWFSAAVPLSGLVRMDTTSGNIVTKVEVTGFGGK